MEPAILETTEQLETPVAPGIVRRSDRGLCVAGTKISLFSIVDYIKAGKQEDLLIYVGLSEEQLNRALAYIEQHREEFEANYAEYVRKGEELEQYYRDRERLRLAGLEARGQWPPTDLTPEQAAIWEKLQRHQRERHA
ncbi:MAG: DUF433 domain-containing protein [Blastocatellia bacterium]